MSVQPLQINIYAGKGVLQPEDQGRCRWQVSISTENSKSAITRDLKDPFTEKQKIDCRWYIEEFVRKKPYSLGRAGRFEDALEDYAISLFGDLQLTELINEENGLPKSWGQKPAVILSIYDDENEENSVHQLHWEILENPEFWGMDVDITVKRVITPRENVEGTRDHSEPVALADASTPTTINGLLVTARDLSRDTALYKDISPHLALGILARFQNDLSKQKLGTRLNLEVARPGSIDALDRHLKSATEAHGSDGGSRYHFVHFDLHGIVTASPPSNWSVGSSGSLGRGKKPQMAAYLLFNDSDPDTLKTKGVSAEIVGKILVKNGVRIAVLNACESAREGVGESANLARTFMNSGVENVLAMSFSVNRSAAEIFLRAFYYGLLLKGLSFSGAAGMGREVLRIQPERDARMSLKRKLIDHFVPVTYSAKGVDSQLISADKRKKMTSLQSSAFALSTSDPNDRKTLPFVGREFDLLRLEKQLLAAGRVYLSGRPGVGKSSLLRYASKIWIQTSFVDSVVFIDFTKVKDLADAVKQLVSQLPGDVRTRKELGSKVNAVVKSSDAGFDRFSKDFRNSYPGSRFVFIFDGLQAFHPKGLEEEWKVLQQISTPKPSSILEESLHRLAKKLDPEIARFMRVLLNLRESRSTENDVYQILANRSKDGSTLPFEEKIQNEITETQLVLRGLDFSDSIELSQALIQRLGLKLDQSEEESKALGLLMMLLDGNPSTIVHVLLQIAKLRNKSMRELRDTVQHGISLGSYSLRGRYGGGIFEEIDDAYRVMNDEQRAFVMLFSAFWSEASPVISFVKWVTRSGVCKQASNSLALQYFLARGFLEYDSTPCGKDGEPTDPIVTWIHPLLTLYGRRAAYDLLPKVHLRLSQQTVPGGLQTQQSFFPALFNFMGPLDVSKVRSQTIAGIILLSILNVEVKFYQLPMQLLILSGEFKKEFLGWISETGQTRLAETIGEGFSNNDLHQFWVSEAANLATCLSICTQKSTRNDPTYFPVKEWPMEYFCFHVANIRLVGATAQVAEFAAYFERLLQIYVFLTLTKDRPVWEKYQRSVLMIANCLVAIYANEVPNPAKRTEYIDKALKFAEGANSKAPDVMYLKALTLRYQALHLFQQGDGKGAWQVWQEMNEMENLIFNNLKAQSTSDSNMAPEKLEELNREISSTEGTTQVISQKLMSLSSNTMLKASQKPRKNDGKLFEALATGKYEKMGPRARRGLIHDLSDGMRDISIGATKMGWNKVASDLQWWPEKFNLHGFIDKFDDADRRLDALEEAMESGNTTEVRDQLVALMMRAHEYLEVDDVEEYINALDELAQRGSVPELKEIDWQKQKLILRTSKVSIGLLSGKGTRKTVGRAKPTLDWCAEAIEDQVRTLKEEDGPLATISTLEATLKGSQAGRAAAKASLEDSVKAAEKLLHVMKKQNKPREQIAEVEASIKSMRADREKQSVEQGVTAESAKVLQDFSTAVHRKIREDPTHTVPLVRSHFQLQQRQREFDEAEAKDDYGLALRRLDAFEQFLELPEHKIFKEGYEKDVFKKKRYALQFLQAAQPISEEFLELLHSDKVEEARDLLRGFEGSLSPELRKAGEKTLVRLMKITHEFPFK